MELAGVTRRVSSFRNDTGAGSRRPGAYLPIPKSLPMDNYFNDATGAYLMAASASRWRRCWKNYFSAACCIHCCDAL